VVRFATTRPGAIAPARMTEHAAGYDLAACLGDEIIEVQPGARTRVPTGLRVAIPPGFEGQVRPRSGWADRAGITVLNAPGTIDADYRGEVMVLLVNLGDQAVNIRHADRIAQLVIAPVVAATFELVPELEDTTGRGSGGFGSTGR
jgi:dUTP pyrophosphatase